MGHGPERAVLRADARPAPRPAPTSQLASNATDRLIALQREAGNSALSIGFDVAQQAVMLVDDMVESAKGLLPFDTWFNLRMALLGAVSDIGTAEVLAETVLIEARTAQIKAEAAAIHEETTRIIDHRDGHPGDRQFERLMVLASLAGGQSSDVELTDIVFLARHPERRQAPLEPGKPEDAALIREWVNVRTSLVRSVMSSALGKAVLVTKKDDSGRKPAEAAAQGT